MPFILSIIRSRLFITFPLSANTNDRPLLSLWTLTQVMCLVFPQNTTHLSLLLSVQLSFVFINDHLLRAFIVWNHPNNSSTNKKKTIMWIHQMVRVAITLVSFSFSNLFAINQSINKHKEHLWHILITRKHVMFASQTPKPLNIGNCLNQPIDTSQNSTNYHHKTHITRQSISNQSMYCFIAFLFCRIMLWSTSHSIKVKAHWYYVNDCSRRPQMSQVNTIVLTHPSISTISFMQTITHHIHEGCVCEIDTKQLLKTTLPNHPTLNSNPLSMKRQWIGTFQQSLTGYELDLQHRKKEVVKVRRLSIVVCAQERYTPWRQMRAWEEKSMFPNKAQWQKKEEEWEELTG